MLGFKTFEGLLSMCHIVDTGETKLGTMNVLRQLSTKR